MQKILLLQIVNLAKNNKIDDMPCSCASICCPDGCPDPYDL